jgi:hypothetical protein
MDFHFWIVSLVLLMIHLLFLFGAWHTFRRIPDRRYTPWFLPMDADEVSMPLMQHMRVRLRVKLLRTDSQSKRVTISIPPRMTMGDLFRYFVFQRQKIDPAQIEYRDTRDQPYAWEFYASKWGGLAKRILDPGKTLIENKLESYSVIIVKRIPPKP